MIEGITTAATDWKVRLNGLLPLYGHRNWIVVADSAYPAQSKQGIETIVSVVGQIETVDEVLNAVAACKHIRAKIYLDLELDFVSEGDAPGVSAYRSQLESLFRGQSINRLPHEEIIAKLDQSAKVFRVLIIKTKMTIPYTSVFLELDCGYWDSNAEQRLRTLMSDSNSK